MTYRPLFREELEAVRNDFVRFLAANGIPAEDWKRLLEKEPAKAEELIKVFSDIFWDEACGKIEYLHFFGEKVIRAYRADAEVLYLIELRLPEELDFDLRKEEDRKRLPNGFEELHALGAEFLKGRKDCPNTRNHEVFQLLEGGAQPCGPEMFEMLFPVVNQ